MRALIVLCLTVVCGLQTVLADIDLTGVFPPEVKCVHLVAPSSLPPKETVIRVTNALTRAGYRVKVSPGVWSYAKDGAQRARYLESAWGDPETDLILCARGGRGGYDTVTNLDFSILKSRDVPFVGFSNVSCLMNAFVAKGVGRPISGPMCTSMVSYPTSRDSLERLSATVSGGGIEATRLKVLRPALQTVVGKPIGGHWPSLSRMDATWLPSTSGRIVFLEINKTYSLEKAKEGFRALKRKGFFENPAAVILCDLGISGTKEEKMELIRFAVDELTCPVFQGYPYGHVRKSYAIDYGRTAEISVEGVLSWRAPDAGATVVGCRAQEKAVRVMTFNVRMGCGHDDPFELSKGSLGHLPQCAEVIRKANPDLVAVQEIDCKTDRAGGVDQTAELARLCGLHGTFVAKTPRPGGQYGLALLSRKKPLSVEKVLMPGKIHTRCLMICEFDDCIVANTHFPLSDEKCREAAEIVCRTLRGKTKPVVLMGDLNSDPDTQAIAVLKREFRILSDPAVRTWPAKRPDRTIDYIMIDRAHADSAIVDRPSVVAAPEATDHCAIVLAIRH